MMSKQQHLLLKLSEECNEVAQIASKCMQFGFEDGEPNQPFNNAERLNQELNDLMAQIEMLGEVGFYFDKDRDAMEAKRVKVRKFYKYSQSLGMVE